MNQQDIILKLKDKTRLSTSEVQTTLKALKEIIYDALANGEKVQFLGFGTLEVKDRKEREGRNPRTKEPITIPASKIPHFKPGKEFKDKIQR